ncbi:flagellar hook assembly protein FlgD [Peribacillus cavernae]|uniref:Basal-body rod modification protein FlgD n=1 Tax=Peribacillus cavernae TaxID=1674310 RepID=A0A3S0U599_9BACI|nr:flagellar hook assembly protein FlgD [Peribacillus cavernae]MDQ0217071.1 flagellar basal-body rod modification protein FlgD [Peribacillus cavernae]RUQ30451.1 flagellar hook assembly protein FlgD [Peribacillus cavernae]
MNTIDSSLLLSGSQEKQRKTGSDVLGKDDFLKILMTQLQNQDPSSPMEDKDFIAQMATFSTLEQITNMGKSIDKFVQMEQQNKLISYNQFVGKDVTWHKVIPGEDPNAQPAVENGTGLITSIQFKNDSVYLILEDGTTLEPGNISQVNQPGTSNSLITASELIGKTVTWSNNDNQEASAAVKSVQMKDGKTQFELDDGHASKISANQIIKIAAT